MNIEHIAVYVKDLEKTKKFYETYFSAKSGDRYHNATTGFSSYFLTFETGSRLEIMNLPTLEEQSRNAKRSGFIHLAFSVGSEEKVRSLTERLRNDGYEIASECRITGDGYFESCVMDGEGNVIEITV